MNTHEVKDFATLEKGVSIKSGNNALSFVDIDIRLRAVSQEKRNLLERAAEDFVQQARKIIED